MRNKADSKSPIENWKFEVKIDPQATLNLLNASAKSPINLKMMLPIFGKAITNGERYIESRNFLLLEDGTLIQQPALALAPDFLLEIDLIESSNLNCLASFEKEFNAREARNEFHYWRLTGHLKTNGGHVEDVVMDDRGGLYLHNRRMSWNSLQHQLARPLP